MFGKFYDWAHKRGWNVKVILRAEQLPEVLTGRYSEIDDAYKVFLSHTKYCVNPGSAFRLYGLDDYMKHNLGGGIISNEFEIMSLNSAKTNKRKNEIKKWWDRHIPVALSLRNGYSYYAINMNNGTVIAGREQNFEAGYIAAKSFQNFIDEIMNGKIK